MLDIKTLINDIVLLEEKVNEARIRVKHVKANALLLKEEKLEAETIVSEVLKENEKEINNNDDPIKDYIK